MTTKLNSIAFGGGCHWCTEAVFQSLKGVFEVKQGWVHSIEPWSIWSEGVLLSYDENIISLADLIEIHLYTHGSTSTHKLTEKYRSAIYFFSKDQEAIANEAIKSISLSFEKPVITKVIPYVNFKINEAKYLNYYNTDKNRPFCEAIISPKLKKMSELFKDKLKS